MTCYNREKNKRSNRNAKRSLAMRWLQSGVPVLETAPASAKAPKDNLYKLASFIAQQPHADSIVLQLAGLCREIGFHDPGKAHEET